MSAGAMTKNGNDLTTVRSSLTTMTLSTWTTCVSPLSVSGISWPHAWDANARKISIANLRILLSLVVLANALGQKLHVFPVHFAEFDVLFRVKPSRLSGSVVGQFEHFLFRLVPIADHGRQLETEIKRDCRDHAALNRRDADLHPGRGCRWFHLNLDLWRNPHMDNQIVAMDAANQFVRLKDRSPCFAKDNRRASKMPDEPENCRP